MFSDGNQCSEKEEQTYAMSSTKGDEQDVKQNCDT